MRLSSTVGIVMFSLGFSCADVPVVEEAAAPIVSTETPFEVTAPPAEVTPARWSFHGFHGAWAIFAQAAAPGGPGEASTVAVQMKTQESARFAGRPVIEPEPFDERPYAMQGSPLGVSMVNARTAQGRYLLLEREGRVEVADLATSSIVTLFEGAVTSAEFGADGRALVVWTEDALHVLGVGTARRASLPLRHVITSGVSWDARGARFFADDKAGWQFFDRATWSAWSPPRGAKLMQHADDGSMLLLHGTSLEWWNLGDAEPRASVDASALAASNPEDDTFFESLVNDRTVAYSVAVSRGENQAPAFDFHVTSWDESDEVVFRGVAECGQAPEHIVSVGEREIKTDVACSLGCPSEPFEPEYAFYDRRTGVFLRRVVGETEPSYNDEQAPLSAAFEEARARLHLALEDAVGVPRKARRFLMEQNGELALVSGKSGKTELRLADSAGLSARAAVFSVDGAWLSLPRPNGFTVWNLRTGAAEFTVE